MLADRLSWDTYNEFLLHGTIDRFGKILARYELFRQVVDLPGDIVECGVFKGAGVLFWAKLIQLFNPLSTRRVVGFDTFSGYSPNTNRDFDRASGSAFAQEASYEGVTPDEIMAIAASLGLEARIQLVAGDASKTVAEYVRTNPGFRVALLNMDFDVYEPTMVALKELYPLIVPQGILALDEYAVRGWGESDAVDAYFGEMDVVYRTLPWAM